MKPIVGRKELEKTISAEHRKVFNYALKAFTDLENNDIYKSIVWLIKDVMNDIYTLVLNNPDKQFEQVVRDELVFNIDKYRTDFDRRDKLYVYTGALQAYTVIFYEDLSKDELREFLRILFLLIDGIALTVIEDVPETWEYFTTVNKNKVHDLYRCVLDNTIYKKVYPNGDVEYFDTKRFLVRSFIFEQGEYYTYHNEFVENLIQYLRPIEMPYVPGEIVMILCEESDGPPCSKILAIKSVQWTPHEEQPIERYFKMIRPEKYEEITEEEYEKEKNKCLTK